MNHLGQAPAVSARIALARLAAAVVALDSGVEATAGRGRWVTADERRPIAGVVASVEGDEVGLELHLVVRWPPPPLDGLARKLRAELRREAERAGLGDRLGAVTVSFHDLALPGEDEASS